MKPITTAVALVGIALLAGLGSDEHSRATYAAPLGGPESPEAYGHLPTGDRAVLAMEPAGSMQAARLGNNEHWTIDAAGDPRVAEGRFSSPVFRGIGGEVYWAGPRVFVVWSSDDTQASREQTIRSISEPTSVHHYAHLPRLSLIGFHAKSGEEILEFSRRLSALDSIELAEPDFVMSGRHDGIPNDPYFTSMWHLQNTGQSGGFAGFDLDPLPAWDHTTGASYAAVLVLDTGVEQSHPDLYSLPGRDFTTGAPDGIPGGDPTNDCENHGTAVAGCISALTNNALGTAGIAPLSPTVSARTFYADTDLCDGSWYSYSSWTVNAINWSLGQEIRITNNSNRYGFVSSAIEYAYETSRASGQIHFASIGNDGESAASYPASLPSVIGVGAADRYGGRSPFSNFGSELAFLAPGSEILSSDRQGSTGYSSTDYCNVYGTSFAAPLAAGVASLVLAVNPDLTSAEVEAILVSSCRDMSASGWDEGTGWGLLQASEAVSRALCPDSDADGTSDCEDECPFDPAKTSPGRCGCGVEESMVPGDFNCDGVFDHDDYVAMGKALGECPEDINGDGEVSGADLGRLLSQYGTSCP